MNDKMCLVVSGVSNAKMVVDDRLETNEVIIILHSKNKDSFEAFGVLKEQPKPTVDVPRKNKKVKNG